jgi:predicted O-methyltransferase YrrM
MSRVPDIVESIVAVAPSLHGSGALPEKALRALARHAFARPLQRSVETGSGASTLLLSHAAEQHTTFTVDSGTGSLRNVERSPLLRADRVVVVEGLTHLTLPRHQFSEAIQLALIDGPHAYPFPDLEYFHLYPHVEPGGILIVDDIHIPTIHNMFEFISADDMWTLNEVVENTAFFTRTDAPTFQPHFDGWWRQKYNRRT